MFFCVCFFGTKGDLPRSSSCRVCVSIMLVPVCGMFFKTSLVSRRSNLRNISRGVKASIAVAVDAALGNNG